MQDRQPTTENRPVESTRPRAVLAGWWIGLAVGALLLPGAVVLDRDLTVALRPHDQSWLVGVMAVGDVARLWVGGHRDPGRDRSAGVVAGRRGRRATWPDGWAGRGPGGDRGSTPEEPPLSRATERRRRRRVPGHVPVLSGAVRPGLVSIRPCHHGVCAGDRAVSVVSKGVVGVEWGRGAGGLVANRTGVAFPLGCSGRGSVGGCGGAGLCSVVARFLRGAGKMENRQPTTENRSMTDTIVRFSIVGYRFDIGFGSEPGGFVDRTTPRCAMD